jgi:predicted dehydrogenase
VRSLRVGVSGCHPASTELVLRSRCQNDCDVVAAHDDEPEALAALCTQANVGASCPSFAELLATGVDFVVLAGPLATRLEQVRAAAAQVVPCLLLAPFAPDLATATAMVAECDQAQMKLGVLVPSLHDPLLDQLRRMIAQDWLGGIVAVQGIIGDTERLHGDRTERPHPFVALTSRQIHLASWLVGRPVVRVTAQTTHSFSGADDAAVATAVLRGGAVATFTSTHLAMASAFAVHGTDGAVRLDEDRLWLLGQRPFRGDVFDYASAGDELVLSRGEMAAELAARGSIHEPLGCFARWLEECDDFPCPAEQALEDLRVVAAMLRAAQSGQTEVI